MDDLGLTKYFLEKGILGAICVALGIALYRTYAELREAREYALKIQRETTLEIQRLNKEHREELKAVNDWAYREISEIQESRSTESKELSQKLFETVIRMKEAMDLVSNLAETSIRGSHEKDKAEVRKVPRNRGGA